MFKNTFFPKKQNLKTIRGKKRKFTRKSVKTPEISNTASNRNLNL
jgi:hypothetical protein